MSTLHGCDISTYQATTPSGYDFYIIKASEGVGFKDPRLDQHYNQVAAWGKPYGFYHYARPDLGNTPEAEADWFLSLVGHHAGDCLYALDWEGASLGYPVSWPLAWCQRVYERTGVRPVFYCSQYPLMSGKYAPIAKANFGLWMAQYASSPILPSNSGWSVLALWQSGDSPVDQDIFYGDLEAWEKYCGVSGGSEKPAEPARKSNEEIAREVMAGRWGNGAERISRLRTAGYDPAEIQRIVNGLAAEKPRAVTPALIGEVAAGKWGNGYDRASRLKNAGYNPDAVQDTLNRYYEAARATIRGDYGNEPQRSANLRAAGFDPSVVQGIVNSLM